MKNKEIDHSLHMRTCQACNREFQKDEIIMFRCPSCRREVEPKEVKARMPTKEEYGNKLIDTMVTIFVEMLLARYIDNGIDEFFETSVDLMLYRTLSRCGDGIADQDELRRAFSADLKRKVEEAKEMMGLVEGKP